MLSVEDARSRWLKSIQSVSTLAELKHLVKQEGEENPCQSGLRSVCWKIFLLFQTLDTATWTQALADTRNTYSLLKDHFLKYVEHPEQLDATVDPLNDDESSPWNSLRQDEETRAEIQQDVERCMPDEPFFRQERTQRLLLDALFVYCKLNPDVGYRQGMHELLAPIVWVVENDAIDASADVAIDAQPDVLGDVLDQKFKEHDSFTLFSLLMQHAKSFYELGESERKASTAGSAQSASSPIVERSKQIHETYLAQVDPELSNHLTKIEILPQIFLIRWIRLLFGREFPFDDLLALWDTLFAEDSSLELVNLICVSMLLRVRWQVLESNYTMALTLLLKYPPPAAPYGPESFVEDAIYLKEHLDPEGGAAIIMKYSGRQPRRSASPKPSQTTSQAGRRSSQPRPVRNLPNRPTPAQFRQQQARVEAFLQGAAKGVLERGEKLGINQAVRDAMGEVKKNMQGLQVRSPGSPRKNAEARRRSFDQSSTIAAERRTLAAMELRDKQLGAILEEALEDLRGDDFLTKLEQAIAKIEAVKGILIDGRSEGPARVDDDVKSSDSIDAVISPLPPPESPAGDDSGLLSPNSDLRSDAEVSRTALPLPEEASAQTKERPVRPTRHMPTRSSLAQSSFAFMLEPDESKKPPPAAPSEPSTALGFLRSSGPRPSSANREKAAFLFGDIPDEEGANKHRVGGSSDTNLSLDPMKSKS